jgi:hypothetical protein
MINIKLFFKYASRFIEFLLYGMVVKEKIYKEAIGTDEKQRQFYLIIKSLSKSYYECEYYDEKTENGIVSITLNTNWFKKKRWDEDEYNHELILGRDLKIEVKNRGNALGLLAFGLMSSTFFALEISLIPVVLFSFAISIYIFLGLKFNREQGRVFFLIERGIIELNVK